MQNTIAVLIAGVFLMAMLSFAIAANERENETGKGFGSLVKNITNETERHEAVQALKNATNVTFGECISEAAKQRNSCYAASEDARKNCTDVASTDKAAKKQCQAANKEGRNSCKTLFKSSKDECKSIRHNAWDSIKAAFA